MSLAFQIPGAHDVTVAQLCGAVGTDGLVFVRGGAPSLAAPWPTDVTFVARRDESTRPIEIVRDDDGLSIRLLTHGACDRTAALGVALIAAAARSAAGAVIDEEGLVHDVDAFVRQHALFGLSSLRKTMAAYPARWATMGTMVGALVVSQDLARALGDDADDWFATLRARAWVHLRETEAPLAAHALGSR
jgi:hypothetical protein